MATRAQQKAAQAKAAETKRRSDANKPGSVPRGTVAGPGSKRAAAAQKNANPVARSQPAARRFDLSTIDWGDPEVGRIAAELNSSGQTVKQLTETMGLPAEQPVWRKVSLAMRAWKDTNGIARPGRRSATPVAAPTGNGSGPPKRVKKEEAPRRVTLTEMSDEEVTAAIEGRWVSYRFASAPGVEEVFVARVMKYAIVPARGDRGQQRVVTFIDHVSSPTKAEVKASMEEKREPREHADGVSRSLYVDQIIAIGKKG